MAYFASRYFGGFGVKFIGFSSKTLDSREVFRYNHICKCLSLLVYASASTIRAKDCGSLLKFLII